MPEPHKFTSFLAALARHGAMGLIRPTDTLKVMLTADRPPASVAQAADLAEIEPGNGYPAGGLPVGIVSSGFDREAGEYRLVVDESASLIARGGPVGPFRCVVLYNATPPVPAVDVIAWWERAKPITLEEDGDRFTIDFDGTGVLKLG